MSGNVYSVVVTVKHPSLHLGDLDTIFDINPYIFGIAGERRRSPKGDLLKGTNDLNFWRAVVKNKSNDRFSIHIRRFLGLMEKNKDYFENLVKTGGYIAIHVNVPGKNNVGDMLTPKDLGKLGALGVSFGFEVFPDS